MNWLDFIKEHRSAMPDLSGFAARDFGYTHRIFAEYLKKEKGC
ncbi:MAG: hypothetical protein ABH821_02640 [archaeon]